jgi:hypothetical protein
MKLYDKKDKRYLYQIIDLFSSGEIDEKTFCDEYYYSYDLAIDYSTLTEKENDLFFELSKVVSRFSEFPEDHKLDSKAFTNKEELKKKILEIKNALQRVNEDL